MLRCTENMDEAQMGSHVRCVCARAGVCMCACEFTHTLRLLCGCVSLQCLCLQEVIYTKKKFNQVPDVSTSADWTGISQTSHVFLGPTRPAVLLPEGPLTIPHESASIT